MIYVYGARTHVVGCKLGKGGSWGVMYVRSIWPFAHLAIQWLYIFVFSLILRENGEASSLYRGLVGWPVS